MEKYIYYVRLFFLLLQAFFFIITPVYFILGIIFIWFVPNEMVIFISTALTVLIMLIKVKIRATTSD